jgi:hypothetical protein
VPPTIYRTDAISCPGSLGNCRERKNSPSFDATLDSENPRLKDFWSQNPIRKSLLDFLLPGHFSVTYKKFMMPVILAIAVMLIGETGIT